MPGLNDTIAALRRRQNALASSAAQKRMRELPHFGANPGALRALVYTPATVSPMAPLVVALHGCTQSGEAYAESAGWLSLSERHGFAVLAPEQTRGNNANLCFNWFQPNETRRDQGEAASIANMIRHLIATEVADPKRIFITGLSAGGAMSAAMLATYPELFAAGAVIAGLPYGAATDMPSAFAAMAQVQQRTPHAWGEEVRAASHHQGPWPAISIWHGDADATVRIGAADALVRQWTNVHGVDQQAPAGADLSQRRHAVWTTPNGQHVVEFHQVRGMGHGAPLCVSGPESCGVASPYMLDIGISSSLECARTWGIADASPRVSETARSLFVESDEALVQKRAKRAPGQYVDVGAIISSALRSAGLMK